MKNTREHILDVTFKLFQQKSFKEVTLKEIVEKTGLSKGAFYHYFTSKEQIFIELINNVFNSVLEVPYDQFSKDSLYHFYIDYVNYYTENLSQHNEEGVAPSFNYINLIFEAIKLYPDFKERLQKSNEVQLSSWKNIIHTARENGEINSPMSDEQIASLFINSSSGVEMQSVLRGYSEDVGKTLISLWDGFYKELKS
jgi:TetR/AcrR family transcriptional regulator, transcriptional repressor for nem operon